MQRESLAESALSTTPHGQARPGKSGDREDHGQRLSSAVRHAISGEISDRSPIAPHSHAGM